MDEVKPQGAQWYHTHPYYTYKYYSRPYFSRVAGVLLIISSFLGYITFS